MSILTLGISPTEIKRMPITCVKIYDTSNSLILFHPEAESSFRIVAKTRSNDSGSQVTIGYTIESSIYIPYNEYKTNGLFGSINSITAKELGVTAIRLYFGTAYPSEVSTPPKTINSDAGMVLMLSSDMVLINIEIETVELRPRLIIKINGFVRNLNRIFSTLG